VAALTVPRHQEGELIKSARNSATVGSLIERTTCQVILARLDETDAVSAKKGLTRKLKQGPPPLRRTLTYMSR
jgi:IS30 family transposase